MKKLFQLHMLFVILLLVATACSDSGDAALIESGLDTAVLPGNKVVVTADTETMNLIFVNNVSNIIFPMGTTDNTIGVVSRKFFLSETEVTNALCVKVLQWAYDNKKIVDTAGAHNEVNSSQAKYGDNMLVDLNVSGGRISFDAETRTFSVESGCENHPAIYINWFGAVMLCNWLTEMRDGDTENVVYTNINTSWSSTETSADESKTGYRLPVSAEWEFAARYIGTSNGSRTDLLSLNGVNPNSLPITNGYYWTPGNYASGSTTYCNDDADVNPANGVVDAKDANDLVAVYREYWNGTAWTVDHHSLTDVASKLPNVLGLYDMGGSAGEWCFEGTYNSRMTRGGDYGGNAADLRVGYEDIASITSFYSETGFRIARTK